VYTRGGWREVAVPSLPRSQVPAIEEALSCPSAQGCMAVLGDTHTKISGVPSVEPQYATFRAGTWRAVRSAARGFFTTAGGVSCASFASCTAVGSTSGPATMDRPFAEYWNGQVWTTERVAVGHGSLDHVSCFLPYSCVAVGHDASHHGVGISAVERP
jgi:hypothetical protein